MCFPFTCLSRVPGSLTRMFPFRFTCFSYFTDMDRRLVYAYHFVLCLPFTTHLQSRYSWTLTRTLTHLPFTTVCTCISQSDIYTIGDGDSSLIFNLLCNHPKSVTCEIPRTLLVPSSSLAKATALRSLGGVHSPLSVIRLPVVKSSLCVYFGTPITVSRSSTCG